MYVCTDQSSDCFHMLRQFLCAVCGVGVPKGDDEDDGHQEKEPSVVLSTMQVNTFSTQHMNQQN